MSMHIDLIMRMIQANPGAIYVIVATILLLESSGVPVANNTVLLFTGALASMGKLDAGWLLFAAFTGSSAGACLAYLIGLHGGKEVFLRLTRFLRMKTEQVERGERWFQRSGIWMIFLSRMTPYIRPFACFFGGIAEIPFWRFFGAATVGSLIWCAGMIGLGLALGSRWRVAFWWMRHYTLPTCLGCLGLVLLFVLVRHAWLSRVRSAGRLVEEQELQQSESCRKKDLLEA